MENDSEVRSEPTAACKTKQLTTVQMEQSRRGEEGKIESKTSL